ncbi:MAG: ATP-binding protein [Methylococcales bacterium]|nr:ATP-binding protein [Methylococcales bacterium]
MNIAQRLTSIAAEHCILPFSPLPCVTANGTELPYHGLKGPGFERLCYELLLKEQPGRTPRFFGVSGQAQYGIDLIGDEPDGSVVYQCKNLKHPLTEADLSKILELFKTDWLGNANLPKPSRFVLCCPQDFADRKARDYWERQTGEFPVKLSIWQRNDLDSRLRKAPDIVSDLFSDTLVHAFCDNADDWKPDIFWPIKDGASLPAVLRRYQQRHVQGRLYYDAAYQKAFDEIMERERVVLIQGLPGSGKTLMATAFARAFQNGQWRVYYLNVAGSGASAEAILRGIRLRLSRPTLILLDNVHNEQTLVQTVFERLQHDLNNKPLGLILLARHIPVEAEERGDDWELREQLLVQQAVINFVNKPERFAKLVATLKPDFPGLNPARLKKLAALTGRDFLLLDELLVTLAKPEEIDTLDPLHLLTRVKQQYFGTGAVYLPTITRLTALAQFDLNPLAAHFDGQWQTNEQARCQSLMVLIGQPAHYQFLHSSLAELIFHALTNNGTGKQAPLAIMEQALLAHLRQDGVESGNDLVKVLRAPLPLLGWEKARAFKARLLEHAELQAIIFGLGFKQARLAVISSALIVLRQIESPYVAQFTAQLAEALQQWIDHAGEYPDGFGQWRAAINVLRQADEVTALALEKKISQLLLPFLIRNKGTVVKLFKWVEKFSPEAAHELIALLDSDKVNKLVDNTLADARSIGTLNFTLLELRKTAPDVGLALEQAIGAAQLLKLIESNGTVFELFRFAQDLNTETARELIALLSDDQVRKLVDKTIASTRSIGTLDLALFELRKTAPDVGLALEQAIGAAQLLKLIESNGTVFELFKFAEHLNPKTARELIALLNEDGVRKLVDKTIASGRSIGTLDLALFGLSKTSPDVGLALEQAIGAAQLLNLIESNGTVLELFKFAQHLNPETARELIALLNEDGVRKLVAETIASTRSIGTLDLALFTLRKTAPDVGLALEQAIGAAQLLKLIASNGTVFELFRFAQDLKTETARKLIALLNDDQVDTLVNKTIAAQRSIGTLSFTLKDLKQRGSNTGKFLEAKLGAPRFWRLLSALGNPKTLADLTESMSENCAAAVLAQARHSDSACWNALFERGSLFEAADFIIRCPAWVEDATLQPLITASLQQHAERLVNASDWYGLDSTAVKLAQATNRQMCDPLHMALQQRFSCCSIDTLTITGFAEAVHALSCLARETPLNRPLLAQQLWQLLPTPANWVKPADTFIRNARILFGTLADSAFSAADAITVLEIGMGVDKAALLIKASTQDVMLYWWSLYSLWFVHCQAGVVSFAKLIPAETLQSLQKLVEHRAKQKLNRDENPFLLALLGLLVFLGCPPSKSSLKALANKFNKPRQHIEASLLQHSFVPAYFGLHGLKSLFPASPINPFVQAQLQVLGKQYPNPTPAVLALCATLNKAKGRVRR